MPHSAARTRPTTAASHTRGAASAAAALWFTAPRNRSRPAAEQALPPGLSFDVAVDGHAVRGTRWGSGPMVYLVHGWGGHSGQFGPLVAALVAAGHGVVAFDGPSHGRSGPRAAGGRRTHAVEFARSLAAVVDRHGPAYAVVARSLGAVATGLAVRLGWVRADRLVLVAPLTGMRAQLDAFADRLALPARVRQHLDRPVEAAAGVRVADFGLGRLVGQTDAAVLVVQDRDDRRTPYAESAALVRRWPAATLLSTDGLGHRRVLADPEVVGRVVAFLAAGVDPAVTTARAARTRTR